MASPVVFTPLSQLKPRDYQAVICARVIRKWNFTGKYENGPVLHVDLILADEQKNVIYAEIPGSQVEVKGPLLEAGKTYIISRFKIRGAKSSYMPVAGNNMVEITYNTLIEEVNNVSDAFPTYVQTIVPFEQIRQHIREHPDFIDVIGVIARIDQLCATRFPGRADVMITRDIIIKDLQDKELRVTLWGRRGKDFDVGSLYNSSMPRAIVVLFVGCVPKEFQKAAYVTGNNACHWYFNPPIEEAQPFYARFQNQHFPIEIPVPAAAVFEEPPEPIVIEHKSVQQLNQILAYDFPAVGFYCTVNITDVAQDESWWYLGCRVCKKSSSDYIAGAPWCTDCSIGDFRPRYKLHMVAADTTADAHFFCFDAVGQEIVKKSCEAVLKSHGTAAGTPAALTSIVGNRYTFAVGLTSESYHSPDARVYLINRVVEDFQRRAPPPRRFIQQSSSQTLARVQPLMLPSASTIQMSSPSTLATSSSTAGALASSIAVSATNTLPGASNPTDQLLPITPSSKMDSPSHLALSSSSAGVLASSKMVGDNLPATPPSAQQLLAIGTSIKGPLESIIPGSASSNVLALSTADATNKPVKRRLILSSGDEQKDADDTPDPPSDVHAEKLTDLTTSDPPGDVPAQNLSDLDTSGKKEKLRGRPECSSDSQSKRSKIEESKSTAKSGGRRTSSGHHAKN